MTMRWLITVQEAGIPGLELKNWPAGIEFDLSPRWISRDPKVGNEPSPNPNCCGNLRRWPRVGEIRRPDGTRINAEISPRSVHLNFPYKLRLEPDAAGRIRSPWRQQILLRGVSVEDVPLGSEIWGEVSDEDFQDSRES